MERSRLAVAGGWILAVALTLLFVKTGVAKVSASPMMVQMFGVFGYPLWFLYVTGYLELIAALLTIVPSTSRAGALLIVCIMAGAIVTHLTHGQAPHVVVPIVVLALALGLIALRGGFRAPLVVRRAAAR